MVPCQGRAPSPRPAPAARSARLRHAGARGLRVLRAQRDARAAIQRRLRPPSPGTGANKAGAEQRPSPAAVSGGGAAGALTWRGHAGRLSANKGPLCAGPRGPAACPALPALPGGFGSPAPALGLPRGTAGRRRAARARPRERRGQVAAPAAIGAPWLQHRTAPGRAPPAVPRARAPPEQGGAWGRGTYSSSA